MTARDLIEAYEREATLLDGAGDRFSGSAIIGLPFASGHILAFRRFTVSSLGPGYISVWHRNPSGSWTIYSTAPPECSCARYFGEQIDRNVVAPIAIEWTDAAKFRIVVGDGVLVWHVELASSFATRLLNAVASVLPERAWQSPAVLRWMGRAARLALGTGRFNFTGMTPNRQRFVADARRVWLIDSSRAMVEGVDLGPVGALSEQAFLGDLRLPQRGLFAIVRARFEQAVAVSRRVMVDW